MSPTSPAYDVTFEAFVNLNRMSIDASVSIPSSTIAISPGIMPNCLRVAGRAMIPAPAMVVDRLKTAPEKDAPVRDSSSLCGRRGAAALGLRRCFRSDGIFVNSVKMVGAERDAKVLVVVWTDVTNISGKNYVLGPA